MLHLGGKTWRRRPVDGDKSSELSVAERQLAGRAIVKKKNLSTSASYTQKNRSLSKTSETESRDFKVYFLLQKNALAQKQSVNHFGAFMSV